MEVCELPESEIPIVLFLKSFGRVLSDEELIRSLNILLASFTIKNGNIKYVDDGIFSYDFAEFLICFDSFLIAPEKTILTILSKIDPREELN